MARGLTSVKSVQHGHPVLFLAHSTSVSPVFCGPVPQPGCKAGRVGFPYALFSDVFLVLDPHFAESRPLSTH